MLQAQVTIADAPHYATLVRVKEIVGEGGLEQIAVDDPDDHLGSFDGADPGADGPFYTVSVPGHAGDWVLLMSPFCK